MILIHVYIFVSLVTTSDALLIVGRTVDTVKFVSLLVSACKFCLFSSYLFFIFLPGSEREALKLLLDLQVAK